MALFWDAFLYGTLLGVTLSFMIGPVFLVLLETSIRNGIKAAITFDVGVLIADALLITAAFFSTQKLQELVDNPWVYRIGGIAIAGFGVYSFSKARLSKASALAIPTTPIKSTLPPHKLLVKGFLLNFLNVGVMAYWLTMSVVISESLDHYQPAVVIFFVTSLGSYLITDIFKIIFAAKLRRFMTPRRMVYLERLVGLVLMAFGVLLILKQFWGLDW
jgi:threonine/homoserine/homoserine lactone efflux protein